MRTSRLSRRLESIIKFLCQILPLIYLILPLWGVCNGINNITSTSDVSSIFFKIWSEYINSMPWDAFNVFGSIELFDSIYELFNFDENWYGFSRTLFCYSIWLIFIDFVWLIKDLLLCVPRIVSRFINKIGGGDLD